MNTTITLENGRTMELKQLNKFQVGMETRTHNGEFFESYAIISLQDVKKIAEEELEKLNSLLDNGMELTPSVNQKLEDLNEIIEKAVK